MNRLARIAWLTLGWTVAVILWGAFVRATGSGAGCGAHWPLCNGEVVPRAPVLETMVEYTHRLTSGLALLLVLALAAWVGGAAVVGSSARSFDLGITGVWYVASLALGCLLFGLFMSTRVKQLGDDHGHLTYPDFIEQRFDGREDGMRRCSGHQDVKSIWSDTRSAPAHRAAAISAAIPITIPSLYQYGSIFKVLKVRGEEAFPEAGNNFLKALFNSLSASGPS